MAEVKAERKPLSAVDVIDVEFGDDELIVREYSDGMFTLHLDGGPHKLLLNGEQMQTVVGAFLQLGKDKGWT